MTKLSSRVWESKKLTTQTKTAVYRACVLSTLLYGSESWTTYAGQEKRLHTFHMRCLRRILSIHWTDKVTNNIVLERAGVPTIFTLLRTAQVEVAGSYTTDVRWTNSKRPPLWRTRSWIKACGASEAAFQGTHVSET